MLSRTPAGSERSTTPDSSTAPDRSTADRSTQESS